MMVLCTVDPRGDYFADARPKLLPLADYAERFGDRYVRIDAMFKVGDQLVALDLLKPAVSDAMRGFTGTQVAALYESELAAP